MQREELQEIVRGAQGGYAQDSRESLQPPLHSHEALPPRSVSPLGRDQGNDWCDVFGGMDGLAEPEQGGLGTVPEDEEAGIDAMEHEGAPDMVVAAALDELLSIEQPHQNSRERPEPTPQEIEQAAITIQAGIRGAWSRRDTRIMQSAAMKKAVQIIQAGIVGVRARQQIASLRDKCLDHAVRRIQGALTGSKTRRELNLLKVAEDLHGGYHSSRSSRNTSRNTSRRNSVETAHSHPRSSGRSSNGSSRRSSFEASLPVFGSPSAQPRSWRKMDFEQALSHGNVSGQPHLSPRDSPRGV